MKEKIADLAKIILVMIVFIIAISLAGTHDYHEYQRDMANHPEWAQFYND